MIIAAHHREGGFRNDGYQPTQAWPEDCYVQWGGHGLVLGMSKGVDPYTTAFFEAFPNNPSTFIRGEGKTVSEAEEKAFTKWERIKACTGHLMNRSQKRADGTFGTPYTNGCGFCENCGMSQGGAFEPLPPVPCEEGCMCLNCIFKHFGAYGALDEDDEEDGTAFPKSNL